MKTCAICGERSSDSVETCPNDGEASWVEGGEVLQEAEAPAKRSKRSAAPPSDEGKV